MTDWSTGLISFMNFPAHSQQMSRLIVKRNKRKVSYENQIVVMNIFVEWHKRRRFQDTSKLETSTVKIFSKDCLPFFVFRRHFLKN